MRLYRELAGIYRINGLDNEVCARYMYGSRVDMANIGLRLTANRKTHGTRKYRFSKEHYFFHRVHGKYTAIVGIIR